MATVLFICSLFFLGALGSAPKPCTSPDLLEGQKTVFDQSAELEGGSFSYDAVQKRIFASKVTYFSNGTTLQEMEFLLFQESVRYQFYPESGKCVKSALHTPFQHIEVPSNATLIIQTYIGGSSDPQEGLLANIWNVETGDGVPYILTFTAFGCLPLSVNYYCKERGWIVESINGLTTGIRDPNVFIPPASCTQQN
ncbi:ependymin-like [Hemiscyllium ocellatum]|uniref:ependymin-like n=1 Tax=Hemiscyllium ocellatum TaxID=170820 RepID=UPI002966DC2E|nr:ependymin-like [Hemiscyllium ocellatum]